MHVFGAKGQEIPGTLYGKVVGTVSGGSMIFSVRFTSVSPEIETFLRNVGSAKMSPAETASLVAHNQ